MECKIEDCESSKYSRGLCRRHYDRHKYYGTLEDVADAPRPSAKPPQCTECNSKAVYARGLCGKCYHRNWYRKALEAVAPEWEKSPPYDRSKPNGYRRKVSQEGYVEIKTEKGFVKEHRYVMEQSLGRPPQKGESVHHRNGIRYDNRLENLELWVTPQPRGQRVEDMIAYLVEFHPDEIAEALQRASATRKPQLNTNEGKSANGAV